MAEGFTFQGTGKISRVDKFTTKAGKLIVTLVFEFLGQYPKWVPMKAFGRLADDVKGFPIGTTAEVTGELSGREYQGKYYAEIIARTVDVIGAIPEAQGKLPDNFDDTPF